MHKVNPKDLPELKVVDITITRAVVIFATVALFFVMPVLGVSVYNNQHPAPVEVAQPQVAGISTEATNPNLFLGVDMSSQQGIFLMIGVILVGIAVVLTLFFVAENVKKKNLVE